MFGIGLLVGLFYFGSLWLTVSRIQQTQHPMALMLGSLFVRLGITLVIFYLIARGGQWERIIACLLGFLVSRIILVRHYQPPQTKRFHYF
jgi:F1F0 ATPase subunit 2